MEKNKTHNSANIIVEDPDIRGGIPTIRGTRVGAYEIAGYIKAGGMDELEEDYPTVSREDAQAALDWAEKNPRPPRKPGLRPLPEGARLLFQKSVDLKQFS